MLESSSNIQWNLHLQASFETAGNYPEHNYNWLFGSICIFLVSVLVSRIDGRHADYLFLFTRGSVTEETMPCMPSPIRCTPEDVSRGNILDWNYTFRTLCTSNINADLIFILFADYTKVMGIPLWGMAWLVYVWIGYDKVQHIPATMTSPVGLFQKLCGIAKIFIVCVGNGFVKCSIFVLRIMLPNCGVQVIFALCVMLCVQIESAYTFDVSSKVKRLYNQLDADVWKQVSQPYSSSSLHVITLTAEEIAGMKDQRILTMRVVIDVILMIGIYNNMGFMSKYLTIARCMLLFALLQPEPMMFMHFTQWNFTHMMVVGFNSTGFHFGGLLDIVWHNMFWLVKYSWCLVLCIINFILVIIEYIGWSIGAFAMVTTGDFKWQNDYTPVPIAFTTWMKGVSISIAVLVILVATQCERVSSAAFYKKMSGVILPWPYFIRQSHVFCMNMGCVVIVAFIAFRANTKSSAADNLTPIVFVQICAFDTLLIVTWFVVELLWVPLRVLKIKSQCVVSYNTIQVAITSDNDLYVVRKCITQRVFMWDCMPTTICDLCMFLGDISESLHYIMYYSYPVLTISPEEESPAPHKINTYDGFRFQTPLDKQCGEKEREMSDARSTEFKRIKELKEAEIIAACIRHRDSGKPSVAAGPVTAKPGGITISVPVAAIPMAAAAVTSVAAASVAATSVAATSVAATTGVTSPVVAVSWYRKISWTTIATAIFVTSALCLIVWQAMLYQRVKTHEELFMERYKKHLEYLATLSPYWRSYLPDEVPLVVRQVFILKLW